MIGRPNLAEIAEEPLLGVATLLLSHDHHRSAGELRRTGHNRRIVAKCPVAVELLKIGKDALDIVQGMGTLGMPRQLHPPPGWVGAGPHFGASV